MAGELRGESDELNTRDILVEELIDTARKDDGYQDLRKQIANGFENIKAARDLPEKIRSYFKLRDELSEWNELVLYKGRIIIPISLRKQILNRLHASHQGYERTRRRATNTVFWPGITADIKSTVDACSACQELRPSLPAESSQSDPKPSYPFQEAAADVFEVGGVHYLAFVDRYSGWL